MAEVLGQETRRLWAGPDSARAIPLTEKGPREVGFLELIAKTQIENNERLHMMACRLEDLAARMLGEEPRTEKESPKVPPLISGIVGSLAERVVDTESLINRISAAISRLEKA